MQTIGALLLAGALLATPAVLNRFPFIFYDSSSYIARATFVTHPELRAAHKSASAAPAAKSATAAPNPGAKDRTYRAISRNPFFLRPVTYSVLLVPFSIPPLFYLLPFAQGFFCAYVIRRLLQVFDIQSWRLFFATIVGLTALSSLPIHVSYAMPDVYTGILVVMSFVTVFAWPRRTPLGRLWDAALMTGLVAVHLSHLPITLALIVLYGVGALVLRGEVRPAAVVLGVVAPMAIAISLLVGSNMVVAKHPVISESSPLFLLARLIGDGPAVSYLEKHCGQKKYLLCDHMGRLSAHDPDQSASDFFLWDPDGAVKQIADPRLLAEAAEIDGAAIREFPMEVAANVVSNGASQLVRFQIDTDINSATTPFVVSAIRDMSPELAAAYLDTAQAHGAFPITFARILLGVGLGLAFAVIAVVAVRFRAEVGLRAWAFVVVAMGGIAANALATGGLSEVHDRYGNRVIWLAPFAALVLLAVLARRRAASKAAV